MRNSQFFLLWLGLLLLSGCGSLSSIPYTPAQTPESWLAMQPFVTVQFGLLDFILVQPSSTIFVYALGLVAMGVGIAFWRKPATSRAGWWWGAALLLWGVGALLAGTSYQAFSYEIKCAGRALCSWTSWWEVFYLIFSAASIFAMVAAVAHLGCTGRVLRGLVVYALAGCAAYTAAVLIGAFSLNTFLISFELLLLVAGPNILLLFGLNLARYLRLHSRLDLTLALTWVWLGIVIAAYYLYLLLGFGEQLWERGIWFSENDVLHLGLISWMLYIGTAVGGQIKDRQPEPAPV